jgi:hypothetical protein
MQKARKYSSNSLWAATFIVVAVVFVFSSAHADDRRDVESDVARFFQVVSGRSALADCIYFTGQESPDNDLAARACLENGVGPRTQQCFNYKQCRFHNRDKVRSYYLTALSRVLPHGKPGRIDIEKGEEGYVPYIMVHVHIGDDVVSFHRTLGVTAQDVFGRLHPARLNGIPIDVSKLPFPEEVFESDPCRSILMDRKQP